MDVIAMWLRMDAHFLCAICMRFFVCLCVCVYIYEWMCVCVCVFAHTFMGKYFVYVFFCGCCGCFFVYCLLVYIINIPHIICMYVIWDRLLICVLWVLKIKNRKNGQQYHSNEDQRQNHRYKTNKLSAVYNCTYIDIIYIYIYKMYGYLPRTHR